MCGIVAYVGNHVAVDFLLDGLRRVEYRGYDSAGLAIIDQEGRLQVRREVGRIDALEKSIAPQPLSGETGIAHTRWATHGDVSVRNAHPHSGASGLVALVHNGVIENHQHLKQELESAGRRFSSSSDTEVIAQLVESRLVERLGDPPSCLSDVPDETILAAVQEALSRLRGTYGVVMVFRGRPDLLVAARLGSPLIVGTAADGHYVASDVLALNGYSQRVARLSDHQVALIRRESLQVFHRADGNVGPRMETLAVQATRSEPHNFEHYMLKEIFEQPSSLGNAIRGRLNEDDATAVFGGLNLTTRQLRAVNRIVLTGCGTSWHAALLGEYFLEELARIPVEVEYASELRYRNPPMDADTLVFAITQSGETADTLGALRELKRKGHHALAICNVVGSSISQEADGGVYLHAGPEIGVASTKAYTSQCLVLAMLGLYFGRLQHLSYEAGRSIIDALKQLPDHVASALQTDAAVREIAQKYQHADNFLYLGRQYNFPTALEGALKLKEISYVHAEGYPAAEMKHGPIALVDEETPSVFIVPRGVVYEKVLANMEEIKARRGRIIAIVTERDERATALADDVVVVPAVEDFLQPIVSVVPLQLLAYHVALLRGCDVDKPRNLAKSVTVE
jgi:glucosamine--fructose-6-phosphate aminotransferase (isomerizing)